MWEGAITTAESKSRRPASETRREEIEKFMSVHRCPVCRGTRLKPETLAVKIDGKTIAEHTELSVVRAARLYLDLRLGAKEPQIAVPILKEIQERLGFLENVGLGYFTLD